VLWPARTLQQTQSDLEITVIPITSGSGFEVNVGTNKSGERVITSAMLPQDADVIVIQRPSHPMFPQFVQLMRDNGKAVVIDMDDNMSAIHTGHAAYRHFNRSSDSSWRAAIECCKLATLVTTSTHELQHVYATHGRGVVLDNYVPKMYLNIKRARANTFGWAGSVLSHPDDLQVAAQGVRKLIAEDFPLYILGDSKGLKSALRLTHEPTASGWVDFSAWVYNIALNIDVGIAPLAPTAFNKSKSRLKPIEYMSVGVPWVASPRAEYRRLHRESRCGLMADSTKEWYTMVKKLLTDDTFYTEQSEAGRSYMQDQTYEKNAWRWAEAWTLAYNIQRGIK
jgi:hypothetical protein